MGYRNKYGITKINNKRFKNLILNWDYNRNPKKKYPVFLFTPDMKNPNTHYHISLNRNQAKQLKKWLDSFLSDTKKRGT